VSAIDDLYAFNWLLCGL